MSEQMKLGMIGLDTSHVTAFANILHDKEHPYHVPGAKVVVAYPGGSPDFDLSISRVEGYTNTLRDEHGVKMVDSIEEVAESSDAILLESVDGRVHLEQFSKIASYGKPVYIDKPLAVTSADAKEIFKLAKEHNVPVMSSSAVRYAEAVSVALADDSEGKIIGADTFGPMAIIEALPGYFWYGIHAAEMLYRLMGTGCEEVTVVTTEDHDSVVGRWQDGRIGTMRGNRSGNNKFGGTLHREGKSQMIDVTAYEKPFYASMLEHVIEMFKTGKPPIDPEESIEVIRFLEAANESRQSEKTVKI